MFIHRLFKGQFPLRNKVREVAFLCFILLMSGCGEGTVDNPLDESADGSRATEDLAVVSPIYYPMTLGSRWVYRSPDGSEWSREVTEIEEVGSHLYHTFGYDSPIGDDHSAPSETPTYTPTPYAITRDGRLIYDIKLSDLNEAVAQTISRSGRVPPNRWVISLSCRTDRRPRCRMEKLETIVRNGKELQEINNDALMWLHRYDTRVVWNSELTVLRIPLVPHRRWKAMDVRVSGTKYIPPSGTGMGSAIITHLKRTLRFRG